MAVMFNNTPITFSEMFDNMISFIEKFLKQYLFCLNVLPAKKLPGQKAGYKSHITEVSVGNKVPEHSQKIAHLYWVDVGFVNVSMNEVRKTQQGIEQVTQGQVQDQGDGVELKHRELLSVFWSYVGKTNQG